MEKLAPAQVCTSHCDEHLVRTKQIEILEEKLSVVEENTKTVNKLATKVSLLLTIMSFTVVLVTSAAIYTFTGLASFKETYAEHRLQLHSEISKMHIADKEFIQKEIKTLSDSLDVRISELSRKVTVLETTVSNTNNNTKR